MQFLVTAYDGTDEKALERRLAVRDAHMDNVQEMYKEESLLYAAAILDDREKMIGSILIVDFPSEQVLRDTWFVKEPYILGDVWRDITIQPCKVPLWIRP